MRAYTVDMEELVFSMSMLHIPYVSYVEHIINPGYFIY